MGVDLNMATTDILNAKNEKVGSVDLKDDLISVEVNSHLLHEIVRMQLANRRSGNACTKTRGEVSGGGAKPWKQKGTGRARSGSKRSPLWRGGGTIFGPKPRDYSYSLPKKMKKLGVRMALSSRFQDNLLTVIDSFTLESIKTKDFVNVMNALKIENALIVTSDSDAVLNKSSRNVAGYKVLPVIGLNVYDILLHKHIVLLETSIPELEKRLLS
jgi:large subunit ribosomal protein L4